MKKNKQTFVFMDFSLGRVTELKFAAEFVYLFVLGVFAVHMLSK